MDGEMLENFRANFRYWRLREGITARQVCRETGRREAWLSSFEMVGYTPSPGDEVLKKLAAAVHKPISELVKEPGDKVIWLTDEEKATARRNLEAIRKHHGFTVRQMADWLNVSKSAYSSFSTGRSTFRVQTWWRLADLLDMDLHILIGRKKKPHRKAVGPRKGRST